MIKAKDILTAINVIIAEKYPGYPVYPQACPKDFVRPSFLLEYVRTSRRDANRNTLEKTVYFTITCFVQVDKHFRSDMDKLADLQEDIMQLFAGGYVSIGNRAIKVQSSTGGIDFDRAYIDLQFEYFDNRTDAEDNTPLVESVQTEIQEG